MELRNKTQSKSSYSIRQKWKRVISMALSVLMVTSVIDYTGLVSVNAQTQSDAKIVTAFAELPEDIYNQQISQGSSETDVSLPNTLNVTVKSIIEENADTDGESAENITQGVPEVIVDETAVESTEESTDTNSEINMEESQNTLNSEETSSENADDSTLENEVQNSELDQQETVEIVTVENAENYAEPTTREVETVTQDTMDAEKTTSGAEMKANTSEAFESILLENITWKINASSSTSELFDSSNAGAVFFYEPVLPEGYTLADGVSLPQIQVQIEENVQWAFSQSQTIDGIEITVMADPGVFPDGALLNIKKITDANVQEKIEEAVKEEVKAEESTKTVEQLISFDITITDTEGNELQPDTSKGEVRVSFAQLPMVTEDIAPTQELKVFHMDDSLNEAKGLNTTVNQEAESVEAPAEHFSLYTVALLKSGAGTTYDISDGALIINSSNFSTYDNATITGTISNEAEQLVIDGVTVNLFIEDLSITITGYGGNKSGIALKNGATLNLTVKGTNALTGEYGGAGIHVPQGCTLNITEESTGTLTVTGGNGYGGGAGIGAVGNQWNINDSETVTQSVGTIIIAGGTIIATGGSTYAYGSAVTGASGIGGSTASTTGDILISGGTVTATGGYASAGIGGGHSGCVNSIRITGGTVTATSGDVGSAIGSGYNGTTTGTLSSGTIEITGGDVTANGNIGYGEAAYSENNVGGMVSIAAGAAVKINGGVISPKAEGVNNYPISVTIYDGRLTSTIENASLTIGGKTYDGTLNVSEPCVGTFNLTLAVQGTLTGTQVTTISGGGYSWEDIALSEDSGGYSKEIGERLYPVYLWFYDPTITADIAGVTISAKRNGTSLNGNDNQKIMQLNCDGMIVKQHDGIGKMTAWMTAGMDTELSVTASSLNDGNAMSMSNQTVNASASGTLIILHDNAGIPQLSQPLDLSFGSITFTENGGKLDITYTPTEGGTPTTVAGQYYENEFEIVQTNNTASTTNQIIFQNTTDFVKVKLNGVNILSQGKAIDLQLSKVQLSLVGTNTIDCGGGTTSPANFYSGIRAGEGSALTIDGGGSLSLINPSNSGAGIGGDRNSSKAEGTGTIRIEGGTLTVYSKNGAGIGSSYYYTGDHPGSIYITGGTVNAYSNDAGAAIGGGAYGKPASVHISGGIVTASNTSKFGTAIGGGYSAKKYGSIKISGGIVTAQNDAGIAIGAGLEGTCPDIEISGGTVIANSIGYGTQGNGGIFIITGGTIHTADGNKPSINVTPTNGTSNVYYTKADVSEIYGITAAVTNASITDYTYGFTDVNTDSNGILHLFLPANAAAAKTTADFNNVTYAGTVASAESNSLKRNIPLQVSKGTITSTGATLNVTANTGNTVYYVASSTELSEGSEVASASGAQSVAASGGTNVITLSGLSANTGYTYYLTAKEGAAYSDVVAVSFTTVKESIVDATVTLTDCDSFTYDGTAKTPTVTVKLNGNTLSADQYEVSYSNSNGGAGNHTSAGTVTVTVTASSGGNYAGAVSQTTGMTYIIAKADQSISITEVSGKKFNDVDFTLETTGGSGTGAVTFSVPEGNGVLSVSGSTATIIGVGEVTVTAIKAADTNYNEATDTQLITIAKATAPSITWPNASSISYGQKLSASALSASSTEYGTFAWTDGSTVPIVTNGGYEVTFTPNAGTVANYEAITNTTKMVVITVSKVTPAVTVSADISDDGGSRKATLTATVTATGDGETPTGTVKFVNSTSGSDVDIVGATAVTITGGKATYTWTGLAKQIYKVKAVYSGSSNYNFATSTELSFDTNKQNQAALNIGSIGTKTYGDGTFTLSVTGGSGGGAVTFESSDPTIVSISGTTATIHKAGSVTITAIKATTDIYNEATASVSLTVGKKTLSVKANDQLNIIKGAAMPELTYTATGLVGSDTFTSPSISTTATDTNTVGEYDITISGGTLANADSYAVTYTKGKLTVVNATYTVTVTNGTGGGSYSEGQTVTITADSRGGYTFTGWSSSDGVTFASNTASTTTFTMPGKAVNVTANYSKNNSGNSGDSNGGSTTNNANSNNDNANSNQANTGESAATDTGGNQNTTRTSQGVTSLQDENNAQSEEAKPYLAGEVGKSGWEAIMAEIEKTSNEVNQEPVTITVEINGATTIPANVIATLRGKNINLVLDMGDGIIWTINGMDVSDAQLFDIDLGVTRNTDVIPEDVVDGIRGDNNSIQIELAHNGAFGFGATLTIAFEEVDAGKFANLFYYNEETGKLEYMESAQVEEDGKATLTFVHASAYTIVLSNEAMDEGTVASVTDTANQTQDSTQAVSNEVQATDETSGSMMAIWILLGIIVVVVIGGTTIYMRRKTGKEEDENKE